MAKKLLVFGVLILVFALILTGCAKKEPED